MRKILINQLIEQFFEQAGTDPEAFIASFKNEIRPLTADEIWAVLDGITNRMDAEILVKPLAMAS